MKTKIFLGMGLLVTAVGFGQSTTFVSSNVNDSFQNVMVGVSTVIPSTSSTEMYNVLLGYKAGENNTGSKNVFAGWSAGKNNTGIFNVFAGFEAGLNTSGNHNIFIGGNSGRSNASGNSNIYIGHQTGANNIEGFDNVFIGISAGINSTGHENVYIGASAGANNPNHDNVFIGRQAGQFNTGTDNILIGRGAGKGTTGNLTGSHNVLIGRYAGDHLTSESYKLYITNDATDTPLIYGEFDNDIIKFNAQKVGIGFEGAAGNEGFGDFPALTGLTNADKYRLFVRGGILAEEVRIRLQNNWPDYVFAKDYKLLSLKDTEKFIAESGHLPNMPSAEKVKAEGVELGNIVTLQQEKIEELTLHLIEQQKQIEELQKQVQLLLNK